MIGGLLALAAFAPAPAAAYDDAGYLAYADRMQERLDPLWDEQAGRYRPGGGGVDSLVNALMLLTHSVAAQQGHEGASRNDHRARLIALALVSPPAFREEQAPHPKPGSQTHAPGWSCSMTGGSGCQHLVFDAEIVDGLVYAWIAPGASSALPQSRPPMIADAIDRTVRGSFWRWPTIRLNQINWYALMYAADLAVTGKTDLVRQDMRKQIERFIHGIRPAGALAGNLGPGMRFHYLPFGHASNPMNVDSAEYANIVLSFTRFYGQARRAGMAALPNAHVALLRDWVKRAIAGYWTHAGYLNWDTGFGFDRWHQAKKLGLAQQALIGIAQTAVLQPTREWGGWAKRTLDRGLAFYEDLPVAEGGLPDPVLFKLFTVPQGVGSARLAAARIEANAARAVAAGLGAMPGIDPPPLYAFDPDIGRLAVTTPAYNTAVVAVSQRAFPYGGIELARLFDGRPGRCGERRRPRPRGLRLARARSLGAAAVLLPDASQYGPADGHPDQAHARAGRRRDERAHRDGPRLRGRVHRSAGDGHADRGSLQRPDQPPVHRPVDRDALDPRAPARTGAP